MRRFTIERIREALRLRELKASNVQISRSIQCFFRVESRTPFLP